MKDLFASYTSHKDLYLLSASLGSVFAATANFIMEYTPREFLGISFSIWFIALCINVYDIHTGIKADTVKQKEKGEDFIFVSKKGWRALEKVFVFTVVIGFLYYFEKELTRLEMPAWMASSLLTIKLIMFFYLMLIELQSIGENDEVRFKKKGKFFVLLDQIIAVVNDGILGWIKNKFNNGNHEGQNN